MAKALFFSLPLDGHVNPSLAVVRELAGRGDDIVYYATDRFALEVQRAGARYRGYRDDFLANIRQLSTRTDELSWLLMRTSASVLETELEPVRIERPDYIISDSVAPWGQWMATILKVPVVTSVSTFAFNRHVMALAVTRGIRPKSAGRLASKLRYMSKALWLRHQLCRTHGVSGPGVMSSVMGSSQLNIVYTSRYFQPCAETFDDRYQFVGPSIAGRVGESDAWPATDRPVVYISLGTLFNADLSFYRRCFGAFAEEPYQVVMSVGTNVPLERLADAPANVLVKPHVPQLEVLQRAAAFVSHGGMNSVSESLNYGVPLVIVPQMAEQASVGRQVEALGAGVYLASEDVTATALRQSVQRVIADTSFKQAAEAVRRSFGEAGGPARAADVIVTFTKHLRPA